MPIINENPIRSCFSMGNMIVSERVLEKLSMTEIGLALSRHIQAKWGDVDKQDQQSNEEAVRFGGRIISSHYSHSGIRFYIITEESRRSTTVVLS